jgi:phage terminase large subunit-like protein
MAADSTYNKQMADYAVNFIECLCHTKGTWAGKPFELIDWQEQIIRDIFGTLKPNGYRQFNTAYVEIPKKMGKSELAAAVALLLTCGDGEERAEVYGCAADRQQATIVFDVAADMVRMCHALNRRVKILASQKRIVYQPTNSSIRYYPLRLTQSMVLTFTASYSTSYILSPTESSLML